ncbi:MAG TPA: hypothetical protein VK816_02450, partial [Jatrophihabitantaceae bacterium]|nr:hypothetical protein [Jatrophihabitantaceae bacterium]
TATPYLCARIEWLPEHDGPIGGDQVLAAQILTRRYCLALARLVGGSRAADLADDGLRLSYQVAGLLRLPLADRQRLLEAATAADRLLAAMLFMRRETALLTHTRTVPISPHTLRAAPTAN